MSGYLVPSNYWRAALIVAETGGRDIPEGRDLAEAYRAELTAGGGPPKGSFGGGCSLPLPAPHV